jgi:hypothetical protein
LHASLLIRLADLLFAGTLAQFSSAINSVDDIEEISCLLSTKEASAILLGISKKMK